MTAPSYLNLFNPFVIHDSFRRLCSSAKRHVKWCWSIFQSLISRLPLGHVRILLGTLPWFSPIIPPPPPPPPLYIPRSPNSPRPSLISQPSGFRSPADLSYPLYPAWIPRRKALLIACTYSRSTDRDFKALPNCWKDAEKVRAFLLEYGWKNDEIITLSDHDEDRSRLPTLSNIIEHLAWLVEGAREGDLLFVHYSGHGYQVAAEKDKFEKDNMDEYILPCDFQELHNADKGWYIIDDELRRILVDPLPMGCRLVALFDCCNSGTLLDLPCEHQDCRSTNTFRQETSVYKTTTGRGDVALNSANAAISNLQNLTQSLSLPCNTPNSKTSTAQRALGKNRTLISDSEIQQDYHAGPSVSPTFLPGPSLRGSLLAKGKQSNEGITNITIIPQVDNRIILGNVISISSCAEGKSTFESYEGGVMISLFCELLKTHSYQPITLRKLNDHLRDGLRRKHEEAKKAAGDTWDESFECPVPQICFARETDIDTLFTLSL